MADSEATGGTTSFKLAEWSELPVSVRRSRKKLYEYIKGVLEGDS